MSLPAGAEKALEQFQNFDRLSADPSPRRIRMWPRGLFPLLMFVLTVLSTLWVGLLGWNSDLLISAFFEQSAHMLRRCVLANWKSGLLFSGSIMLILLAHEFGHYCMMRKYGIHSTYPIFIPNPLSAFGTWGAIIMMDPSYANRKQIFDIGIAGPLAGLVFAVPLAVIGLLYPSGPVLVQAESLRLGQPLAIQFLDFALGTGAVSQLADFEVSKTSPVLMAAWFGMLITGLNMVPISQLDGGHVAFGIFGKYSEWVAKAVFVSAVAYVIYAEAYLFSVMLLLVFLVGLKHPPSCDDTQKIGLPRTILGLIVLSLPILCIPSTPIYF